jgi:hypothetical protein
MSWRLDKDTDKIKEIQNIHNSIGLERWILDFIFFIHILNNILIFLIWFSIIIMNLSVKLVIIFSKKRFSLKMNWYYRCDRLMMWWCYWWSCGWAVAESWCLEFQTGMETWTTTEFINLSSCILLKTVWKCTKGKWKVNRYSLIEFLDLRNSQLHHLPFLAFVFGFLNN